MVLGGADISGSDEDFCDACCAVRVELPLAARAGEFGCHVCADKLHRSGKMKAGQHDVAELKDAVRRVEKRLGGLRVKQANQFLDDGQFASAAAIMLDYYDQCYSHSLAQRVSGVIVRVAVDSTDAQANADAVLQAAASYVGAAEPA